MYTRNRYPALKCILAVVIRHSNGSSLKISSIKMYPRSRYLVLKCILAVDIRHTNVWSIRFELLKNEKRNEDMFVKLKKYGFGNFFLKCLTLCFIFFKYSLTQNFREIERIYKMSSWQLFNGFYSIIPKSQ